MTVNERNSLQAKKQYPGERSPSNHDWRSRANPAATRIRSAGRQKII